MLFPGTLKYVVAAAVAFLIGTAYCQEYWGSYDVMTGRRTCGAAPKAIAQWSFTSHTRRPSELGDLEEWVARNRGSIDERYTAFCHTPLHIAARFGRADLAGVLLRGGADPNVHDGRGDRPLHTAAEYGHPDVVALLLLRGARVDGNGRMDRTALHAAAEGLAGTSDVERRRHVATILIEHGANVNARTLGNRFTPLRFAIGSRSAPIADLLRARGGFDVDTTRVQ